MSWQRDTPSYTLWLPLAWEFIVIVAESACVAVSVCVFSGCCGLL